MKQKLKKLLLDLIVAQDSLTRHNIEHGENHPNAPLTPEQHERNKAIQAIYNFVETVRLHPYAFSSEK